MAYTVTAKLENGNHRHCNCKRAQQSLGPEGSQELTAYSSSKDK
jgi:hypothetical protein